MAFTGEPIPPNPEPIDPGIIERWSSIVDRTALTGSWRKRAFWLLEMADMHGADSDKFRSLLTWTGDADKIIMRTLGRVKDV